MLAACTMFYHRDFHVEPSGNTKAEEIEKVFEKFRAHLISKGYRAPYGENLNPFRASFRLRGSDANFTFRQDWEENLTLDYSENDGFVISLSRIVHHPNADFSEEYTKKFVEATEKIILEATSKPVHLVFIPPAKR